jgi:tRNA A37 threonylcarbamoyladenosine biosynthesis protein TsaE
VYDVDENDDYFEIHHMDLYRLAGEVDLEALDLINVLTNSISLLEWPDRLGSFTPPERLDIDIRIAADDARTVRLTPYGKCWEARVKSIVIDNSGAFNIK